MSIGFLATAFSAFGQGLSYGVMVLGVYITFRLLNFADMTCDGAFAAGGCVSAVLTQQHGVNPFLSLLIAAVTGVAAGLCTGVLNTKLKIPPILAGILTMIAMYSVNLHIMNKAANIAITRANDSIVSITQSILPQSITGAMKAGNADSLTVLLIGLAATALLVGGLYWFFGTEIGAAIRACGNNEDMIRALGQDTDGLKILALMLSNGLIALAGAMITQERRVADINNGQGAIVIGLAAVVIGEMILGHKPRSFAYKLAGVFIGSVVYQLVIALVVQLGLPTVDLKLFTAAIVAVALSVPVIRGNLRQTLLGKGKAVYAGGGGNSNIDSGGDYGEKE